MTTHIRATVLMTAVLATTHMMPVPSYAQGSFGIERGTGRVICTDDGDYTPDPDDPSYAAAAAWDARIFGEIGAPCFSPLTDLDAGIWQQSEPFQGADEDGKQADFRIYVLHDTYSWKIGSTMEIEHNGKDAAPESIFEAPNFNERFCSSKAAFSLGTSSYEGNTADNHKTSFARAETLSTSLTNTRETCSEGRIPIVFGINLGEHEYESDCTDTTCTARQRRVIIISADEISVGVDLASALANGIKDQRVFKGLNIEKYDFFSVRSY